MESKAALLTVAIPLIAFKIWFAILLLAYAPTRDTMVWRFPRREGGDPPSSRSRGTTARLEEESTTSGQGN